MCIYDIIDALFLDHLRERFRHPTPTDFAELLAREPSPPSPCCENWRSRGCVLYHQLLRRTLDRRLVGSLLRTDDTD